MNDEVQQQYATTRNLAARGSFLGKYGKVNWFEWLVDRVAIAPRAEVLDVGCGPAWLWHSQSDRVPGGLRLTLLDASDGMIAEARANIAKMPDQFEAIDFHHADAAALPFEDESFDVVLLLHVLYHVDEPRAALREAYRVLRPGGSVFVSTNARDNMRELHGIVAQTLGSEAVDPGAALFSLDDAERELARLFAEVRRHDLTDRMVCTDPDDAIAVLLSMPPGNGATQQQQEALATALKKQLERGAGELVVTRRTGLVEAVKACR